MPRTVDRPREFCLSANTLETDLNPTSVVFLKWFLLRIVSPTSTCIVRNVRGNEFERMSSSA